MIRPAKRTKLFLCNFFNRLSNCFSSSSCYSGPSSTPASSLWSIACKASPTAKARQRDLCSRHLPGRSRPSDACNTGSGITATLRCSIPVMQTVAGCSLDLVWCGSGPGLRLVLVEFSWVISYFYVSLLQWDLRRLDKFFGLTYVADLDATLTNINEIRPFHVMPPVVAGHQQWIAFTCWFSTYSAPGCLRLRPVVEAEIIQVCSFVLDLR